MKVHRVHKCFLEFEQHIEFAHSLCAVEQKHLHNFKNVEAMNCGWLEILKRDASSLSHLVIQPGENSSWTHGQSWKYVALPFCRKQAFVWLFLSKATSFVLTNAWGIFCGYIIWLDVCGLQFPMEKVTRRCETTDRPSSFRTWMTISKRSTKYVGKNKSRSDDLQLQGFSFQGAHQVSHRLWHLKCNSGYRYQVHRTCRLFCRYANLEWISTKYLG